MKELLLLLREKDLESLGAVRCIPQLRAARHEGMIWLRGVFGQAGPPLPVRRLPAVRSFAVDAQEQLFPPGALTPTGTLPGLDWQDLPFFLPVELPVSALPGTIDAGVLPRLVPGDGGQKSIALKTGWTGWAAYVETAPQVRLEALRFAASEQREALILGDMLPPLPGTEYWMRDGTCLPAGFDFEFPALAGLFSRKHNPGGEAILLFDESGRWEKIDLNHILPAKRSAVRMTQLP